MYLHKMHCLDISDVIKQNFYNRKKCKAWFAMGQAFSLTCDTQGSTVDWSNDTKFVKHLSRLKLLSTGWSFNTNVNKPSG